MVCLFVKKFYFIIIVGESFFFCPFLSLVYLVCLLLRSSQDSEKGISKQQAVIQRKGAKAQSKENLKT
jgi:hypothetical protein